MRIVYDHQIFSTQRYGGITRYFTELVARLAHRGDCEIGVLALAHMNAYLQELPQRVVRGVYVPSVPHTGRARGRMNDVLTRTYLRWTAPDIVHYTYYAPEPLAPRGIPSVLTVYDMIHERCAGYFDDSEQMASRKAGAIERASHVICISEATRRDLLELVPVDPERVSVVHLATGLHPLATDEKYLARSAVLSPYLLFVGERRRHKNFSRFVQALARLPAPLRELRVVLFGGGPINDAERHQLASAGVEERMVTQLDGDDALLTSLYVHAVALVYPSMYEGFGIPILEAMACGCPVICGNTSSLPEVAGAAAEFCDPHEPESIATAISNVAESAARARELRDLGRARSKLFSWDRCAAETHAIYQSLI